MGRKRTWTDEDLRAAVAHASTYTQVVELLRSRTGACSYMSVRVRIAELRIDAEHLERARRDENAARQRANRRGASYSNGRRPGPVRRRASPMDDDGRLREAVAEARSYADVLRRLDLKVGGSVYRRLKRRIAELGLDTGHFQGRQWSKGRPGRTPAVARPLEILVHDSNYSSTSTLKKRLFREGLLEKRCAVCGLTEWRGRPAPLRLDHVNGDRRDNRLENLRAICPNCDAFTDTHCGRNIGRYDEVEGVS